LVYFKKKNILLLLVLVGILLILLCSCSRERASENGVPKTEIRIGLITSQSETEAFTSAHIENIKSAMKESDVKDEQLLIKANVQNDLSYATIIELSSLGCQIIISLEPSKELYVIQAAQEAPDVKFFQLGGVDAENSGLPNVYNFYPTIFESRYVSGVIAGYKLNDMIKSGEISDVEAKIGYIASNKNAENISAYTAFYLGAKSVCPSVRMVVHYIGTTENITLEEQAAKALIAERCFLISQQSYANGAAQICEQFGIFFIGNNAVYSDEVPSYVLTSIKTDWSVYYSIIINAISYDKELATDWSKGYIDCAVGIAAINENSFAIKNNYEDAIKKQAEIETQLKEQKLNIFNNNTWSVEGATIFSTLSNDYKHIYGDIEYMSETGHFRESELRSAPAFEFLIDGITELN
jgi:basic membrane protein A